MIKDRKDQTIEVRENMRGGSGKVTVRHYFKPEEITAKTRLCAEMTLPPGASIGIHEHKDEDEVYIIQRGKALMTDGGKEIIAEAGDAVLTGKGESHSIKNIGSDDRVVAAIIMRY